MEKIICVVMAFIMTVSAFCPTAYAKSSSRLDISKNNISHEISPTLYGINLEDISNTFDGGLVSNLVNNNSFEYSVKHDFAWQFDNLKTETQNKSPMNSKNPSYQVITVDGKGTASNLGYVEYYDGSQNHFNKDKALKADMPFKKDTQYDFSCYLKNVDFEGTISVYLNSPTNSHRINQLNTSGIGDKKWSKLYTTLTSVANEDGALSIEFNGKGTILLDFVTLVSQNSYGYQKDSWKYTSLNNELFNTLLNLKPSFVRFHPNGIISDGTLDNFYSWKDTIGTLEERVQTGNCYADDNIGAYYNNSSFLGMHECMQLSKDLGATPIPVLNVGMLTSNQNDYELYADALNKLNMTNEHWEAYLSSEKDYNSKQIEEYTNKILSLGINSREDYDNHISEIALTPGTDEFSNYVQGILDLIEYANADSKTSYWGALRGANGSSEPFNVKYIALGKNNLGDVYMRNFEAIYNIVKAKYPDIKIIACGCDKDSNDGEIYKALNAKFNDIIIDESYECEEKTFFENNARYDGYDREKSGIMLSQYSVKSIGRDTDVSNDNLSSAIEEASFMTALERNSDVVKFSSAYPTMAKINAQNSKSNLIWFDSQNIVLTPNYFVKMLFANNLGNKYVSTQKINDNLYQSVTVDENTQTLYVKIVNTGSKDTVSVSVNDFGNINAVSNLRISNKYSSAYNKLNTNYVVPKSAKPIEPQGNTFDVVVDKNSVNVIRIAYGENDGTSFYELPEDIDYDTSHYVPQDFKIALISIVVVAIILVIGISIFLKKYEAYKKRNK